MTTDDMMDLAEEALEAWGALVRERPAYPEPGRLLEEARLDKDGMPAPSPQESWVVRMYSALVDTAQVERYVASLPYPERAMVWARYVNQERIREIAARHHMSERSIYSRLDRVIFALAMRMHQSAA